MKKVLRQCIILSCFLFLVTGCGEKELSLEQFFSGHLSLKDIPDPTKEFANALLCELKFLGQNGTADFGYTEGDLVWRIMYLSSFDGKSKYKNGVDFKDALIKYLEKEYGTNGNNSLVIEEDKDEKYIVTFEDGNRNEVRLDGIIKAEGVSLYFELN